MVLKPDSHLPKKFFVCFNDSPLKMMKNALYFILKALFVLKIFRFLSFWACREKNDLIGKIPKLNFKIYNVTAWLTKNYNTHIRQYLMN